MKKSKEIPKGTLFIQWSSIFDNPKNKYDIELFKNILKVAKVKEIWTDNAYGWSNQPEVVLFTGLQKEDAKQVLSLLAVFRKWGPIILDASEHWQ